MKQESQSLNPLNPQNLPPSLFSLNQDQNLPKIDSSYFEGATSVENAKTPMNLLAVQGQIAELKEQFKQLEMKNREYHKQNQLLWGELFKA